MNPYALVQYPVAPLLSKTNCLSTLEDEVLYGMKVELLDASVAGWYRVRTHYRYEAWIQEKCLLFNANAIKHWECSKRKIVLHSYADVLTEPKVQGGRIISLPRGAQVIVTDEVVDHWQAVVLVDGTKGYLKETFLGDYIPSIYEDDYVCYQTDLPDSQRIQNFVSECLGLTEEQFRQRVTDTARRYLGVQYRWGGKTSLGIDCSGLTSTSYLLNGLVIYRDANIVEGFPIHEIPFDQKKPGDLIYFPGHVAMYLGEDRYIHSTNRVGSDGVVINSFNPAHDDYRADLLSMVTKTGSIW